MSSEKDQAIEELVNNFLDVITDEYGAYTDDVKECVEALVEEALAKGFEIGTRECYGTC